MCDYSAVREIMSAATVPVRRDLRVISLIGVAHGSSHYYQLAFVTMLLILRDRVGLSFEQVGILGALFYAVSGFGQTASGFAVDRFGARPILAGGLFALGCAMGFMAVAHSFEQFAAIAVLGGAGNSVFHPADFAILNASVDSKRLGRAFSIHGLGGSLGWAGGPAMYFLDSAVGDRSAALIGAIPGLVLAFLVYAHRTDLVDHRIKARASTVAQPSPWSLFLQPSILLCLAFFALVAANTVGIQQFAVPAFRAMFDVSQSYAAFCLIVFVLGSASGMLLGGWLADRMRHHERGLHAADRDAECVGSRAAVPALRRGLRRRHDQSLARHDRASGDAARRLGQGLRLRLFRPRYRLVPGTAGVRPGHERRPADRDVLDHHRALSLQRRAGDADPPDHHAARDAGCCRVVLPVRQENLSGFEGFLRH
jgi:MFS transporter, FSR family, fosmidomycin resistance protein